MSAIFYHNDEQKRSAENSKAALQSTIARPIRTRIEKAETFYDAEK